MRTSSTRPSIATAAAVVLLAVGSTLVAASAAAVPGYELLDGARRGDYLRLGSRGPAVRVLQRALTAAGEPLAETGVFESATAAAVRRFQARSGCAVDGVVGPQTVAALDRALAGTPPPPAPRPAPAPPAASLASIPPRPAGALTGSDFLAATRGLSRARREAAILHDVLQGNVPDFLRRPREVTASDGAHTVTIRVLPDYLAIGPDADFVRMPMGPLTAQRIADAWGCSLPTRRIVDLVYAQAALRLAPIPLPPGAQMMSNAYYAEHQARVERQRAGRGTGELVAGHKKDVVITNRLLRRPDRVAIYGWHLLSGRPIQPLSLVHENTYADYSHGVRLVLGEVLVDGQARALDDVLGDPVLSRLLSDEGPMPDPRVPGV